MNYLEFDYELCLDFSEPVKNHRFLLRCLPLARQIGNLRMSVYPNSSVWQGAEGTGVIEGYTSFPHDKFCVKTSGRVTESEGEDRSFPHPFYTFFTKMTAPDETLKAMAARHRGKRADAEVAADVMHDIHSRLKYRSDVTDSDTTAARAAALGEGVCQDFAHIFCCVMRLLGVPTRYVAGLGLGHGQTHAWNECYIDGRWRAFDPTNDKPAVKGYVGFAVGADANECALNRGVFDPTGKNAVRQTQSVRAAVKAIAP